MKHKHQADDRAISELLKKLQASYGKKENAKAEKQKKKEAADEDDRKFREQLTALLNKAAATESPAASKKPKKKSPASEKAFEEPNEENPASSLEQALSKDEPKDAECEAPPDITPQKKPVNKPKHQPNIEKPAPKKPAPEAPILEAPVLEKTILEEPISEETVPEETVPEETVPEETVPEETIPKETIPEETVPEETIPEETVPEENILTEKQHRKTVFILQDRRAPEKHESQISPIVTPTPRIVILPKSPESAGQAVSPQIQQDKPIIIKPQSTPTIREQIAEKPIKIGKEILPAGQRKTIPNPADKPKPIMKKEQNTTMIPPTTPETTPKKSTVRVIAKGPATPTKRPGVTMPRTSTKTGKSSDDPDAAETQKTHKETATRRTRSSTVNKKKAPAKTAVPKPVDDESLEEVLNDALMEDIEEEIPIEEIAEAHEPVSSVGKTPAERRREAQRLREEANLTALELIHKRSGLSEGDVAMMLELGYENELGGLVGKESLKRLKSEHLKKSGGSDHPHYRTAYGYRGEEYTSPEHRSDIIAAYLHDRKHLLLRTILTALLSLVLILIDLPSPQGGRLSAFDAAYPILFPILELLIPAIAAALAYRQLYAGLRSLFRFSPTPYSTPALVVPLTLLYSTIALIGRLPLPRIGFASCLCLLLCAFCDILRLNNELRSFRLLSIEEEKTVLAPATPRKKKLRQGKKIVKIINDDLGKNMYRVRSCEQCVGFFRRFNDMHSAIRPFAITLITMLAFAIPNAFLAAARTESVASGLSSFAATLLVSAPIAAMFGYFYPLCRANRLLARRNCVLVGQESVTEYQEPKTVIFRDSDLYTAQKQTEVSVQDGDALRSDLRLSGILFRKIGGALGTVGPKLAGGQADPHVSIIRIHETGVEAVVDKSRHMLIGDAAFLQKGGIRVPRESTDRILRRTANVALLYVAIDGVLKLSYEIEYHTDANFENLIHELAESGTAVAIASYDPNLNETFLLKSRPDSLDEVEVIKPGAFEENKPLDTSDVGALALGKESDIAYPLHAAAAINRLHRFIFRMQLIASLIGGAAITLLSVLGQIHTFPPLAAVAYQLFWMLVTAIAVHSELTADRLHMTKIKKM